MPPPSRGARASATELPTRGRDRGSGLSAALFASSGCIGSQDARVADVQPRRWSGPVLERFPARRNGTRRRVHEPFVVLREPQVQLEVLTRAVGDPDGARVHECDDQVRGRSRARRKPKRVSRSKGRMQDGGAAKNPARISPSPQMSLFAE
jgi:hypothetical protein